MSTRMPRARFADPSNPDRPPKPYDDPAAEYISPNPQKAGRPAPAAGRAPATCRCSRTGMRANRTAAAKEPGDSSAQPAVPARAIGWHRQSCPNPRRGIPPASVATRRRRIVPFLITLDQAVELGGINSREFQDRREDLYLTALPVTLQRFAFSAQFLAAGEVVRQWAGIGSTMGRTEQLERSVNNTGVSKLFSTGALLLLDFANQTVIDFTRIVHTRSANRRPVWT